MSESEPLFDIDLEEKTASVRIKGEMYELREASKKAANKFKSAQVASFQEDTAAQDPELVLISLCLYKIDPETKEGKLLPFEFYENWKNAPASKLSKWIRETSEIPDFMEEMMSQITENVMEDKKDGDTSEEGKAAKPTTPVAQKKAALEEASKNEQGPTGTSSD